ncbi:hypothetical protein ACS0TY_026236 [Phlomoides rotata]
MEQSDFDSITTRVRHLRENIAELERNYNQLTLNVKVSGNVQQANLDIVQISIHGVRYAQHLLWQALKRSLLKSCSPSVTQKERVQQAEPQQVFQVPVRKGVKDVSGQPSTSGVKKEEISLRPQKGPKRDDTNVAGVKSCWFFNNTCRTYSMEWNLMQHILSLMCLRNIHDSGHSKEPTRLLLIDGTSSEPSPQYE